MSDSTTVFTERKFWVLLPLLLAIFIAPILFGGTTPSTRLVIDGLLLVTFLCWGGLLCHERRIPGFSRWLVGPGLFLIMMGAAHLANPRFAFEADSWSLVPLSSAVSYLPGTVDVCASGPVVLHSIALFMALLVVTDLSPDRRVRWWILTTVALSGFVTAMLGIYQKAGDVDSMLWATPEQSGHLFFAAFRYHANAATFLNLCWPAALALWLRDCHRPGSGFSRSFWLVVLVFTFLAVFVNSSKGGQLIGFALFALAVIRYRKQIFWKERNWRAASVSMAAVVGVAAVSILPGAVTNWTQWSEAWQVGDGITGRWSVYESCLGAVRESGVWGMGPGTFHLIFPFYTLGQEGGVSGIWIHAHQDILQTVIEWGWTGFAAIGILVFGGLSRGVRQIEDAVKSRRLELSASCAAFALVGVLVHSMFDFPFQIPAVQLPFVVFLGCFWRDLSRRKNPPRRHEKARKHHAGFRVEEKVLEEA